MAIPAGTPAPDFTLKSHLEGEETLSSHRGKWVILAFHPATFTGGCLNQVTWFRSNLPSINEAEVDLLEVSVDSVHAQRTWSEALGGIPFPILADFWPHGDVAKAYGIFNEETGVARRAAFLIDPKGVVRWSHEYPRGEVPEAPALLEEIQKLRGK